MLSRERRLIPDAVSIDMNPPSKPTLRQSANRYLLGKIYLTGKCVLTVVVATGVLLVALGAAGICLLTTTNWLWGIIGFGVAIAIFGATLQLTLRYLTALEVRSHEAAPLRTQVETCSDVASVPDLIELLQFGDEGVRRLAARSLCRLLPDVDPATASRLHRNHRQILKDHLHGDDVALILAILRMYGRFGNESVLEVVRELASGPASSPLEQSIRTEAGITLRRVRESLTRPGSQLLRPSQAPLLEEALLRAAAPAETPTEELLRPSG
jgi:hypothetical protein